MKFKKILFVIPLLLCCGWTSNYSLEYNGKTFKEVITYFFEDNIYNLAKKYENIEEGEFFEIELVSEDISAGKGKKYKKLFSEDNKTVTLTAKYNFKEFMDSYHITSCFENYEFNKFGSNYEIDLSGEYYCDNFSTLTIVAKPYNVIETNADKVFENTYTWYLDGNNTIHIVLKDNSDIINIFLYVVPVLLLVMLFALVMLIRNRRLNG